MTIARRFRSFGDRELVRINRSFLLGAGFDIRFILFVNTFVVIVVVVVVLVLFLVGALESFIGFIVAGVPIRRKISIFILL